MPKLVVPNVAVVQLSEAWPLWMATEPAARYLDCSGCKDPLDSFFQFRATDVRLFHLPELDKAVTEQHGDSDDV